MEKITLQRFQEIKNNLIELLSKTQTASNSGEELSDEERELYAKEYKEGIKELLNYDLSEIDFNEWAGISLFSTSDFPLDFSKTRANLDCSIIDYWFDPQYTNLKGCKIRNFNFGIYEYSPQMFDDDFIRDNYDSIYMLINEKKIKVSLEDLKRYSEIFGIDGLYALIGNDKSDTIDFIKKYGFDNIIALNKETNGMFSHPIALDMFAKMDKRTPQEDDKIEFSYEQFRDRIYEVLIKGSETTGLLRNENYPNYDFIGGKFREEHQDIFIDDDLPYEIKNRFYTGTLTPEDIRINPELIEILKDKNIERAFGMNLLVIYRSDER